MLTNVAFIVPGQPQGKGRARSTRTGRHYTPAKTVAYESLVAVAAHQAMGGHKPLTGPLVVEIVAVFLIPPSYSKAKREAALAGQIRPTGRPDADNVLKAICDGGNGIVWRDDSQIVDARVIKRYGWGGQVMVNVGAM